MGWVSEVSWLGSWQEQEIFYSPNHPVRLGVLPASYPMGAKGTFPRGKAART